MKPRKSFVLFASLLSVLAMTSCKARATSVEPEAPVEESQAVQQEAQTQAPAPKDLVISKNKDVANYIKKMDFDAEKVWKYDLTGSVTPTNSKTDNGSADKLIVTRKEVRDATSGSGSLHALQLTSALYPGLLLRANSKLVEGEPTAITDIDRGKATYEVVLPGLYDNVFTIEEATGAMYRSKLNQKVAQWKELGKKLTANQNFSLTQTYDKTQLAVDLGFGVAESLKIDAKYKQGGETNIFIASFEQIFYTVNLVVEGRSTVIFDPAVTLDEVKAECPEDQPPLLIRQASYGQVLFLKIETSLSKQEVEAGFSYAGSVDVKAKTEFSKMLSHCKINCLVSGGNAEEYQTLKPIPNEGSADIINGLLEGNKGPITDSVENAVMLSYATAWLKNGDFARVQATTKYVETTYEFLERQTVECENVGLYVVKKWKILARKITGWDTETGAPIFGGLEELFSDGGIAVSQTRSYPVPANYGQVEFHYDIAAGSYWPFKRRISEKNFFKRAKIETGGTTLNSWVRLDVDGQKSKV